MCIRDRYSDGEHGADFHCNVYNGPSGFLDAVAFHSDVDAVCGDVTPPQITCPNGISLECNTTGGVSATDPKIVAFLTAATSTDHAPPTPALTYISPTSF